MKASLLLLPSAAALAILLGGAGPAHTQSAPSTATQSGSSAAQQKHGPAVADEYMKQVRNTSFRGPSNERVLRHEVVVDASLEDVWKTLTTSQGLESFMAPVAYVELKTGGRFDSNYRAASSLTDPGTIHNMVLCYVPLEMFAIKVNLTAQFPAEARDAGTLFAVLALKDLGHHRVQVTESMGGWGEGRDWDDTYGFFDWGNAYTLGQLYRRFKEGPRQWNTK